MIRRIAYVSGTRADFGLMKSTLLALEQSPDFELSILVTGMHLLSEYGDTFQEIDLLGLSTFKCPVTLSGSSGSEMSRALSQQLEQFTIALKAINPDILLLLGDRGEMLAGAIAALHLKVPVAHIHGGERSGTIDESIRHAITKLSHIHFAATKESHNRIIKMGEKPEFVFTTGAPGLDDIAKFVPTDRHLLYSKYNLDSSRPFLILLFHPIVQQDQDAFSQATSVLDAIEKTGEQTLTLLPNSDSGGALIKDAINERKNNKNLICVTHIPREDYLSLVHYAAVLVGNSSSGIIESASLGTPAVNIGDRQRGRERNSNTIDVKCDSNDIFAGIQNAISLVSNIEDNKYGIGSASQKIVELLSSVNLDKTILEKLNTY